MFSSITVLFGVLAALAGLTDAAPLPMPALKVSQRKYGTRADL